MSKMESEHAIDIVRRCGICDDICDQSVIPAHTCLEGYTNYMIDADTLCFYPVLADGVTVIRCSVATKENQAIAVPCCRDGTDNVVRLRGPGRKKVLSEMQNISQGTSTTNKIKSIRSRINYDDEEQLILEVQRREPLWNYALPLEERNCRITKKLWEEISTALNGKLSAEVAKSKFKSLHDTYRRIVQSERCASDSARKDQVKKWHHYHSMEFLRDSSLYKRTVTNIEDDEQDELLDDTTSTANTDDVQTSDRFRGNKKRKASEASSNSAMERIADAICHQTNDIVLPAPPQPDEIDSFLLMLGCRLRRMPLNKQLRTVQQILDLTYRVLLESENNE